MCLVATALGSHPHWPLIVCANRDEFFERPTAPLHLWDKFDTPLYAGTDLQAGGTWVALQPGTGQWAVVTNLRSSLPVQTTDTMKSRGHLVTDATTALDQSDWMRTIQTQAHLYRPFNLLLGQGANGWLASNNQDGISFSQKSSTGPALFTACNNEILAISNEKIHSTPGDRWQKVQLLEQSLQEWCSSQSGQLQAVPLATANALEQLRSMMYSNSAHANNIESTRFIMRPVYGTRSTTILLWRGPQDYGILESNYSYSEQEGSLVTTQSRVINGSFEQLS